MLSLLTSVNKFALTIFVVIFILICYELIQLFKHRAQKKTLVLPDFEYQDKHVDFTPLKINTPGGTSDPSRFPMHILLLGFLFILLLSTAAFLLVTRRSIETTSQTTIAKSVASEGIYIYDSSWAEISDFATVNSGDYVYIGIKTIPGILIDKARIRINQSFWAITDETINFNPDHDVYYIQYYIPQDSAQLDIEAQLHTKEDAWLLE